MSFGFHFFCLEIPRFNALGSHFQITQLNWCRGTDVAVKEIDLPRKRRSSTISWPRLSWHQTARINNGTGTASDDLNPIEGLEVAQSLPRHSERWGQVSWTNRLGDAFAASGQDISNSEDFLARSIMCVSHGIFEY